jgi:hypothetical protein
LVEAVAVVAAIKVVVAVLAAYYTIQTTEFLLIHTYQCLLVKVDLELAPEVKVLDQLTEPRLVKMDIHPDLQS